MIERAQDARWRATRRLLYAFCLQEFECVRASFRYMTSDAPHTAQTRSGKSGASSSASSSSEGRPSMKAASSASVNTPTIVTGVERKTAAIRVPLYELR
jgi:hypothetical protein